MRVLSKAILISSLLMSFTAFADESNSTVEFIDESILMMAESNAETVEEEEEERSSFFRTAGGGERASKEPTNRTIEVRELPKGEFEVATTLSENLTSKDFIENFNHIVTRAYNEDPTCRTVITGNMTSRNMRIAKPSNSRPSLNYAKVLGKSFLDRVCSEDTDKVLDLIKKSGSGSKDALALSFFKSGASENKSIDNAYNTYMLLYTLGQRESNGNFLAGKDPTASNTSPLTQEAGYKQFSTNTLLGKGDAKQLIRDVFRKYVQNLSGMNVGQKSAYCSTNLVGNTKYKWGGKTTTYDSSGTKLHSGFEKYCKPLMVDSRYKGEFAKEYFKMSYSSGHRFTEAMGGCFMMLQRQCPALPTEMGAIQVRTDRKHNGPLWTKAEWKSAADSKRSKGQSTTATFYDTFASTKRPYPKPACKELFVQIYEEKKSLCKK